MSAALNYRHLRSLDRVSPEDLDAVLATARALRDAARAGLAHTPLRGKNIALLCEAPDSDDAVSFHKAAIGLGAQVARIRPSLAQLTSDDEVRHTARMLGRLYDAIECQGVAPELVERIARDAGVPVYDGLGTFHHPMRQLVDLLDSGDTPAQNQRYVLQALLANTIA